MDRETEARRGLAIRAEYRRIRLELRALEAGTDNRTRWERIRESLKEIDRLANGGRRGLTRGHGCDRLELRYNSNHDPKSGRFAKGKKTGKTKYAPSPRRNKGGVNLGAKRYARLCGVLGTKFPNLEAGEVRTICDAQREYTVIADGYGGFTATRTKRLK